MNPYLKLSRAAFVALALGSVTATAAFAQTPATAPSTPPAGGHDGKHHFGADLTDAQKTELKNAHDAVLANNPDLAAEEASLKTQHEALQSGTATDAQKQALFTQFHDFHTKLQAAELKIDPNLAPIFAKLEADHKGWKHGQGQAPAPAPAQT
jgi:Spy/CpxP family protein refolding chaperone